MKRISKKLIFAISSLAIAATLVIGVTINGIDPPNPPTGSISVLFAGIDPPNPPTTGSIQQTT